MSKFNLKEVIQTNQALEKRLARLGLERDFYRNGFADLFQGATELHGRLRSEGPKGMLSHLLCKQSIAFAYAELLEHLENSSRKLR